MFYDEIEDKQRAFIEEQKMFFVATAHVSGRINLSPKGLDCFRVLSSKRVLYADYTGSGNETAAHLRADGRITFMFCSYERNPLILRLYGTGRYVRPEDPGFDEMARDISPHWSVRQLIVADITSVQTSCGFGVPMYDFVGERDTLIQASDKKGREGIESYWYEKNSRSIDGLPTSIEPARE